MKFQCQVRVLNRTHRTRSSPNYVKSTIALGKETHTEIDYFLLHFSSPSRGSLSGSRYTKYRLRNNQTQIFTKGLSEGKITLSFEDPSHDLFIQCDDSILNGFVEILKACLAGEVGALQSSALVSTARQRFTQHCDQTPAPEEKKSKSDSKQKRNISSISTNTTLKSPNILASSTDILQPNALDSSHATKFEDPQPSVPCGAKQRRGILVVDKNKKILIDQDSVIISSVGKKNASKVPNLPASSVPQLDDLGSSSISTPVSDIPQSSSYSDNKKQGAIVNVKNETKTLTDKDLMANPSIGINMSPNCPKNKTSSNVKPQENVLNSTSLASEVHRQQPAPSCSSRRKRKVLLINKDEQNPNVENATVRSSYGSSTTPASLNNVEIPLLSNLSIATEVEVKSVPTCDGDKQKTVLKDKKSVNEKETTTISSTSTKTAWDSPKLPVSSTDVQVQNLSSSTANEIDQLETPSYKDKSKHGAIPKIYKKKNFSDKTSGPNSSVKKIENYPKLPDSTDKPVKNFSSSCSNPNEVDGLKQRPLYSDKIKQAPILKSKEIKNVHDTTTLISKNPTSHCRNALRSSASSLTVSSKINGLRLAPPCSDKKKQGAEAISTILSNNNNTESIYHKMPATNRTSESILDQNTFTSLTIPSNASCIDRKNLGAIPKNRDNNQTCVSKNTTSHHPNQLDSSMKMPSGANNSERLQMRSSWNDKKNQGAILIDKANNNLSEAISPANKHTYYPTFSNPPQGNVGSLSITNEDNSLKPVSICSDKGNLGDLKDMDKKNLTDMDKTTMEANKNITPSDCPKLPSFSTAILEQNVSSNLSNVSKIDSTLLASCSENKQAVLKDQDKNSVSISSSDVLNCPELPISPNDIPQQNISSGSSIVGEANSVQNCQLCNDMKECEQMKEIKIRDPNTILSTNNNNAFGCSNNPGELNRETINFNSFGSEYHPQQLIPTYSHNINPETISATSCFSEPYPSNFPINVYPYPDTQQHHFGIPASDVEGQQHAPQKKMIVIYQDLKVLIDKCTMTDRPMNTDTSYYPDIAAPSTDIPQLNIVNCSCMARKNDTLLPSPSCNSNMKQEAVHVDINNDKTNYSSINMNMASKCPTIPATVTDLPQENVLSGSSIAGEVVTILLKNLLDNDTVIDASINKNTASSTSNLNSSTDSESNVLNNTSVASEVVATLLKSYIDKMNITDSSINKTKCPNNLDPSTDILQKNVLSGSSLAKEIIVLLRKTLDEIKIKTMSSNSNDNTSNNHELSASNDTSEQNVLRFLKVVSEIEDSQPSPPCNETKKRENEDIDKDINTIASSNPTDNLNSQQCELSLSIVTGVEAPQMSSLCSDSNEIEVLIHKDKTDTSEVSSIKTDVASNFPNTPTTSTEIQQENVLNSSSFVLEENTRLPSASCDSNYSSLHGPLSCSDKEKQEAVLINKDEQAKSIISSIKCSSSGLPDIPVTTVTTVEEKKQNVIDDVVVAPPTDPLCICKEMKKRNKAAIRASRISWVPANVIPPFSPNTPKQSLPNSSRIPSEVNAHQTFPSSSRKNKLDAEANMTSNNSNTVSSHPSIPASSSDIEHKKQNNSSNSCINSDIDALQPPRVCLRGTKKMPDAVLTSQDTKNETTAPPLNITSSSKSPSSLSHAIDTAQQEIRRSSITRQVDVIQPSKEHQHESGSM